MRTRRVAVVGSGVIGLTSALALLDAHPDVRLTVVSDEDVRSSTSWGPAGVFRPSWPRCDLEQFKCIRRWSSLSYNRMLELYRSSEGGDSGIAMVSGFVISDNLAWLQESERFFGDFVLNFRWLSERELSASSVLNYRSGIFYTSFVTPGKTYIPWLKKKIQSKGGRFETRKINRLEELSPEYETVVNCCGLSARWLVGDIQVRPIRGVLLELEAPWIKHFLFSGADDTTYILPTKNSVMIGGIREYDRYERTISEEEKKDIWSRCLAIMPSLKSAKQIGEWAGLRPFRPFPRLELESVPVAGSRPLTVVHNYGHGGNGFSLSWGCATQVVDCFQQGHRAKSHL